MIVLFVYGTLAPGELSWSLLAPYAVATREQSVPGRLFDTGRGYPGAVFAPGRDLVHGWCCTLADPPLAKLDTFEGEEYERITVRCTDGTEALAYHWIAPLDGLRALDDGRWRARR